MFRESIGSVRGFRARFASQLVQFGAFRARFASHLVQFGASERVSMSQLVQFGDSERVSRVNWFSSGIQSAFRESIGLVRGFRAVS